MKKIILNAIISISLMLLVFPVQAQAPIDLSTQEKIDNFTGKIFINTDSSILVKEIIDYNFGQLEKHGIYRDITVRYQARGGNYNLRISDISVTDEKNQAYNFSTSYQSDDFQIKIGDADKLVKGKKVYVISYKISRAINFFADYDELYWNLTGNNWTVPIEKASLEVQLPQTLGKDSLKSECFQGVFGSTDKCAQNISKDGVFSFQDINGMPIGSGLTAVVGFPKGIVEEPTLGQKIWEIIKDNGILFLPILVLGILFWLWKKNGRDPKGRGTIIAQFDAPDNLTPMEVGTVIDEAFDKKDFSAEIIFLAIKGYLKIKKVEKKVLLFTATDYELEKIKSEIDLESKEDKEIIQNLFGEKDKVLLSDLADTFYKKFQKIGERVYEKLTKDGYFSKNPKKARSSQLFWGALVIILGFFVGALWGYLGIGSFIISGIFIIVFSFFMPQRTIKGVLSKEHILGLKEYLSVAEKDRINFHNAPEKNPERFEKLLPFAMVLGVEKEWAKKFENIYKNSPSWYEDSSGASFDSILFVSSLNSFSASANSSLTSAPSSASGGGSGFSGGGSGGGFGGGGGGSW